MGPAEIIFLAAKKKIPFEELELKSTQLDGVSNTRARASMADEGVDSTADGGDGLLGK